MLKLAITAPTISPALTVSLAIPPYTEIVACAPVRGRTPPGAVHIVDVNTDASRLSALQLLTASLRTQHPTIPLVARVPAADSAALRLAYRGSFLRIRAVVVADEALGTALRRALAHPICLASDVTEWLGLRGLHLSPSVRDVIEGIVAGAGERRRGMRSGGALSARGTRHRFHKIGIPPPGEWSRMAIALNAALTIQQAPQMSLLHHALEMGFHDHSALSYQVQRAFRVRPTVVRDALGWEWLLDRWLSSYVPVRMQA